MNDPEILHPPEVLIPVVVAKVDTLTAQKNAIDAASTGSPVFRSAAAYLAAHPKVVGYKQ